MRALFIGGIKSGKSKNAEAYALLHATNRPYYLATTEFIDQEMQERIELHKLQRQEKFITLEEPLLISQKIATCHDIVLVECVSMWINNMLYHGFDAKAIYQEVENIMACSQDMVFVINDVSQSVVSDNALVRAFVDINGRVSQMLASGCDAVFHTVAGIGVKIK
jgi:adenosylcobinamide kinase/adenosylcobinamide-phosphate guanylyltransferase